MEISVCYGNPIYYDPPEPYEPKCFCRSAYGKKMRFVGFRKDPTLGVTVYDSENGIWRCSNGCGNETTWKENLKSRENTLMMNRWDMMTLEAFSDRFAGDIPTYLVNGMVL